MKWPVTPDLRRAWAFAALLGGCGVFTVFAAVGVYLVRLDTKLSFYLALAAHFQLTVALSCIGALLVRRTLKASRDGFELSDNGGEQ